jgi:hypothetical protein
MKAFSSVQVWNSVLNNEGLTGTPFTDERKKTKQHQITLLRAPWIQFCRVTRTGRAVLRSAGIIIKCWRGGTRYFLVTWLGANSNDSNSIGATNAYWLSLTSSRRCRHLCCVFFIALSLATSWQKIWRVRNNDRKWMLWISSITERS